VEKEKEGLNLKKGILLGSILTIFLTLPVFFNIFSSIPGKYSDTYQVVARTQMVQNNLEEQGWLGTFVWQMENDFWGIIPLIGYTQFILGENFGYNLWWLCSFFLAFLGAWCFVKEVTKSDWAAATAGFVFSFSSFHLSQAISTNIGTMHYEWLVWLAFFLYLFWKNVSWKNTLGVFLSFLAIIITEHQLLAFTMLFLVAYIPFLIFLYPKTFVKWKFWAVAGPGIILLLVIGFTQFSKLLEISKSEDNYLKPDYKQVENYSADLIDFIIPARFQSLLGESFNGYRENLESNEDGRQSFYLGYSVLLLVLIGIVFNIRKRKSRRWILFWLAIFFVFAVFSLGPTLHWKGDSFFEKKLPYILLYDHLPFWDHIRTVSRVFLVALLGWSFLAGWGAKTLEEQYRKVFQKSRGSKKILLSVLDYLERSSLLKRKGRFYSQHWKKRIGKPDYLSRGEMRGSKDASKWSKILAKTAFYTAVVLGSVLVFEYLHIAVSKIDSDYSSFYDELREQEDNFAILEIPGSTSYDFASYSSYTNSIHRKHMINGMDFARVQSDRWSFQRSTPVIKELLYSLPTGGDGIAGGDIIVSDYSYLSGSILQFYNIRYVVVSKKFTLEDKDFNPEAYSKTVNYLKNNLNLEEFYEDEYISVFSVPNTDIREGHFLTVDTYGDNWSKKEGKKGSRARWARDGARLRLVNVSRGNMSLQITFEGKIKYLRELIILYDGEQMAKFPLKEFKKEYSFDLTQVTPGDHQLELIVRDEKGEPVKDHDLKRGIRLSHFRTVEK